MTDEEWRLTRGRQRYETVAMAATRLGYVRDTMVRIFERSGIRPDDHLDARTPVYLIASVDKMMADRPGRGIPRRPRKAASGE